PKFTTEITNKVAVFDGKNEKNITVKVTAYENDAKGIVKLQLPKDWTIIPNEIPISIGTKGETKTVSFSVIPPKEEQNIVVKAIVESNNKIYDKQLTQISYSHIPKQTILEVSEAKFVNLNIQTKGKNIAYIMGAGDEVGENLKNLNYSVSFLKLDEIELEKIKNFDAIIVGIRAFNVLDDLKFKNKTLFEYVNQGGNVIVQYNTTRGLVTKEVAPYNLELSSDRVTDENASVTFLQPNHTVLNFPNKITTKDFEGWVQERGLYFP